MTSCCCKAHVLLSQVSKDQARPLLLKLHMLSHYPGVELSPPNSTPGRFICTASKIPFTNLKNYREVRWINHYSIKRYRIFSTLIGFDLKVQGCLQHTCKLSSFKTWLVFMQMICLSKVYQKSKRSIEKWTLKTILLQECQK